MNLYPDQLTFVADLRAALRTHDAVLAHAATGFGKTVVGAYIAKAAAAKRKRVIFAVHRRNLLSQTANTFSAHDLDFGFIAAGMSEAPHHHVQIASIETLRRRLERTAPVDLLYIDECHLACSETWTEVIDHFRERGAKVIGNTATPCRLDSKPLGRHFQAIVSGPSVRTLIDGGRLSDYRIFAPSTPDLTGVHTRAGDYVVAELEAALDRSCIVGDAAEHYRRIMPGKRAIAFCVSIKASQHAAEQFRAVGIRAEHIDGETPDHERKRIIGDFADGRITVLCNCDLVTTGFDLSSQVGRNVPVEGAIMLRPTQSLSLWLQMLGRTLRAKPYPAIICDHAGGSRQHGLPCSEREWSLDGKKKRANTGEAAERLTTCEACFAVFPTGPAECPSCGARLKAAPQDLPDVVAGDLEEIDPEEHRRRRRMEEGMATTLAELQAIGRARGYASGWAWGRWQARLAKRGARVATRRPRDDCEALGEPWDGL